MERLEQTGKTYYVSGKKIAARKKTNNKWFETQDQIGYWDDFSKPKIVWAETMRIKKKHCERFPRFSHINQDFFTDKTCFMANGKALKFLLAVLNSLIGRYQFSQTVAMMDNGGYLMQKIYVEQIRICPSDEKIRKAIVGLVDALLETNTAETEALEKQIDAAVAKEFGLSNDEQAYLCEMLSKPLGRR